ncbi:hypothetical protein CVT24_003036 [Panaeolus cyanescens]|uniref:Uncharacterized protein n=1 Tax=Panaeolus cyanescens TaxID=181874 RepID=A0A409VFQ7_9AGAR|nr:hypothetical protein CVT24_003036 [Panaeolus cyanescens]
MDPNFHSTTGEEGSATSKVLDHDHDDGLPVESTTLDQVDSEQFSLLVSPRLKPTHDASQSNPDSEIYARSVEIEIEDSTPIADNNDHLQVPGLQHARTHSWTSDATLRPGSQSSDIPVPIVDLNAQQQATSSTPANEVLSQGPVFAHVPTSDAPYDDNANVLPVHQEKTGIEDLKAENQAEKLPDNPPQGDTEERFVSFLTRNAKYIWSFVQRYGWIAIAGFYSGCLLYLPSLYYSRVSRIFSEAQLSIKEIEKHVLEMRSSITGDYSTLPSMAYPDPQTPRFKSLTSKWEKFVDGLIKEWKTLNIVSALLLSAILTLLQIPNAEQDPITKYFALYSLLCALSGLVYGCAYIIRFNTMREPHKAVAWAALVEGEKGDKTENKKRSETEDVEKGIIKGETGENGVKVTVWWNVWVLLAMPSVWLTWSLILYISAIVSFVWRSDSLDSSTRLSESALLSVRLVFSITLAIAMIYGCLIFLTFRQFGEVMDEKYVTRVRSLVQKKKSEHNLRSRSTTPSLHPSAHVRPTMPVPYSELYPPYIDPYMPSHSNLGSPQSAAELPLPTPRDQRQYLPRFPMSQSVTSSNSTPLQPVYELPESTSSPNRTQNVPLPDQQISESNKVVPVASDTQIILSPIQNNSASIPGLTTLTSNTNPNSNAGTSQLRRQRIQSMQEADDDDRIRIDSQLLDQHSQHVREASKFPRSRNPREASRKPVERMQESRLLRRARAIPDPDKILRRQETTEELYLRLGKPKVAPREPLVADKHLHAHPDVLIRRAQHFRLQQDLDSESQSNPHMPQNARNENAGPSSGSSPIDGVNTTDAVALLPVPPSPESLPTPKMSVLSANTHATTPMTLSFPLVSGDNGDIGSNNT